MSTITRIKGVIQNYSLPVLTENGLMPYWEGHFINGLSTQGYTLSNDEKNAIGSFFRALEDSDIINAIRYYWAFLGSSSNVNAAKVPLIGDKLFDFGSGFSGLMYNNDNKIVGITSNPAISSLNTLDFCNDACMSIAVSYIKSDTSNTTTLSRVLNVNDAVQIRPIQYSSSKRGYGIYANTTAGKTMFTSFTKPENFDDAGNAYMSIGFNNHSERPYYHRYFKVNNGIAKCGSASDDSHVYAPPSSSDAENTVSAILSYGSVQAMTGLVVFNRILKKDELVLFMDAMKALNIALGKEITV